MAAHQIPFRFQRVILDYGFGIRNILDHVVASRDLGQMFAVLLETDGVLWGIEIQNTGDGWEITNDSMGPIESIEEFMNKRVIQRLY